MELFVFGITATVALIFVVYPVISPKKYLYYLDDLLGSGTEKKLSFLEQKKTLVYDNIKDLDFENEMGKLAENDYVRLRGSLLEEAEQVVKEIDEAQIKREIDELIEHEVREQRKIK